MVINVILRGSAHANNVITLHYFMYQVQFEFARYKTKLYSLFTKQYYFPEFGGLGQEAPELASNPGNNCVDPDVYKRTYYTSVTGYLKKITKREFHQTK